MKTSGSPSAVSAWIARAWQGAKSLYLFLLPLRFTFFALVVVAFAFLLSAQGYDIIADLAEDDPTGATPPHDGQRIGFIFGVIFLAIQTWYWSRQLLHVKPPPGRPSASDYPWLTRWLPRIFGIAAFLVAIASLWRVARNYDVPQPVDELKKMAAYLIAGMIGFILFTILRRRFIKESVLDQRDLAGTGRLTKIVLSITIALSLALFCWSTFYVQSTVIIGSAAVVILAFALSVPIGSVIVWVGIRGGVPVLTFLLLWAVLISPFADNHVVETLPADPGARKSINEGFDLWFDRLRKQYPPGPDGRYPVILVATEGGGIRAAYWTAAVLTSLTDTLPSFADHVFAISAVSGGALGASVYDALLIRRGDFEIRFEELEYTPEVNEPHGIRLAAKEMLSEDALAPTLAAMTQPDLAQRFVPVPIFPDRARALEEGWERAWRTAIARRGGQTDDLFAGGFLQMMNGREATLPSLFLNGTIVETGQRIIASNLKIEKVHGSVDELAESFDLFTTIGADVRVSTAVNNSARFTYVAPAGTLIRPETGAGASPLDCDPGARCEHVVDGGYFENSGSATVSDLLEKIARSGHAAQIQAHVIFIQFRQQSPPPIKSEKFANEVLSPVRALLNVRGAHADLATEELKDQIGEANYTMFELVQKVDPKTKKPIAVFPLGWLLADRTRNLMDVQMGPNSAENGANVRRIAQLLNATAVGRDFVQERAALGEARPRFQD